MFATIVAPVDLEETSRPGLDYAVELARSSKGRLIFLHVLTTGSLDVPDIPHAGDQVGSREREAALAALDELIPEDLRDLAVEREVAFGDPVLELQRLADDRDADAIVITVKNRSRTGKLIMGSKAQSIILSATRPVICVPRSPKVK